jgi:hypothetical protein
MTNLNCTQVPGTEVHDRICAEIDAVQPDAVSALARQLFAPDRLSVAGIGPSEERFREAVAARNPALA